MKLPLTITIHLKKKKGHKGKTGLVWERANGEGERG
jgi:hypothetical protein